MPKSKRKRDHTPVLTEGRTYRIVRRRQEKKTMKTLIARLKESYREAYNERFLQGVAEGINFTLTRTEGMEYGAEYTVNATTA